ncbi:hypothetical protein DSL72_001560 [Monilinia vaccinii-corymbosi]|uniref:Uncharacterized protein n=1 Tax=Monilinia vaccinii-corymbosi TaxID=61207 RepID=A0A8A3P7X2_9HELO|nr:hypothetical protein DSL72_001560 [Monilinia vaccinii-corymbosi]
MNLAPCLRKYNPNVNVFRQVDPYTDPIYLQSPHRLQATPSQALIIPRSHLPQNPQIYTGCQSCEDDPRTGAHFCRTCIETQYYALQAQSQAQAQIQDMYLNYATCECPHCDSGWNASALSQRGYGGRYSNPNIEPLEQQLHNTGRYTHMPSSRLGRSPCRDMGPLVSVSCLGALGGLNGQGMSSLGGFGGIGSIGGVRDMRNHAGRYGLQNSRLGYRL